MRRGLNLQPPGYATANELLLIFNNIYDNYVWTIKHYKQIKIKLEIQNQIMFSNVH